MKLYLFKRGISGKFFFTTINISTKYKIQKNNTLSPNSKHRLKMSCADKLFITILNSLNGQLRGFKRAKIPRKYNKIGVSRIFALTHSVFTTYNCFSLNSALQFEKNCAHNKTKILYCLTDKEVKHIIFYT